MAAVALGNTFALALLGLVGAYWTWRVVAPDPEPVSQAPRAANSDASSAETMFGAAPVAAAALPASSAAIRLMGVVAAREGHAAYAVVMVDAREVVAARVGDEVAPGATLAEVAPDHIVLDRNGMRESLAWPEKPAAPEAAVPRANR